MGKREVIILVVGLFLSIGIIIYPPVKMEGYCSRAEIIKKVEKYANSRFGTSRVSVIIPTGDHGESSSPYINWKDERRRLFFKDSDFEEQIQFIRLKDDPQNDEKLDAEIEWESEIYVGRMIVEVLIVTFLTAIGFIISRFSRS